MPMSFPNEHVNRTWNTSESLSDNELWRTTFTPDNTTDAFAGMTYSACLTVFSGFIRMDVGDSNATTTVNVTSFHSPSNSSSFTNYSCVPFVLCDFGTLHIFLQNQLGNVSSSYELSVRRNSGGCSNAIPSRYAELQIILVCLWVG
jgi:hypothetical protein